MTKSFRDQCPVCERSSSIFVRQLMDWQQSQSFSLYKCNNCNIHYIYPLPTQDLIKNFYEPDYYAHAHNVSLVEKIDAAYRFKLITHRSPEKRARALDYGCGKALTLQLLREAGWTVLGAELSEEASRYAREILSIPVIHSHDQLVTIPNNSIDVICLWHALEHIPDPAHVLSILKMKLSRDGILIVQCPDYSSVPAKLFGPRWFHFDSPRHIFHYSKEGLGALLEKSGFTVVHQKTRYLPYDIFGIFQSWMNVITGKENLFNELIKSRKAHKAQKLSMNHKKTDILQQLCATPIAIILTFSTLVLCFLTGGFGTLEYIAKVRSDFNKLTHSIAMKT